MTKNKCINKVDHISNRSFLLYLGVVKIQDKLTEVQIRELISFNSPAKAIITSIKWGRERKNTFKVT